MKYVIVGGVAGGATAAARLRRLDEKAEIVLLEKGAYISYANCGLPYYIGGTITERERLFVQTPASFGKRFNIDVRTLQEAVAIDTAAHRVSIRKQDGTEYEETYDKLLLSPGATPVIPPLKGIEMEGVFTLRNVEDTDRIKAFVEDGKVRRAVVVGGGFIGLEMAENLHEAGIEVSLVEMGNQVMAPMDFSMASYVHRHLADKGVSLHLSKGVEGFSKDGEAIAVHLTSGETLAADLVLLSIGVRPSVALAQSAGISLGERGIAVNEYLETSAQDVYAIGDAIEFTHPITGKPWCNFLAGPANRQGRLAADNMSGRTKVAYEGAIGTAIAKVFDLTVATTGLPAKTLKREGIAYLSSTTTSGSHAGYYPGAFPLTTKLTFAPETGRLLGAQCVGVDGADKRIDQIALLIKQGGTVADLMRLEHAYAPPYSSAKDPIAIAGYVANNVLTGEMPVIYWREAAEKASNKSAFILDARTPEEFAFGSIEGAVNIPLDNLRERLSEVPQDREVIVFCAVGLRGYLAQRILLGNGFTRVRNLSGGYQVYCAATMPATELCCPPSNPNAPEEQNSLLSTMKSTTPSSSTENRKTVHADACGLQCPGPIMKVKTELDALSAGDRLEIVATDPAFARDAESWCRTTGNLFIGSTAEGGRYTITIEKGSACSLAAKTITSGENKTFILFSDSLDRALATFVLANAAAATGKKVTIFFTFWGINVIKKEHKPEVKKDFFARMFDFMLPSHSKQLSLSKMSFWGMGDRLMRYIMKTKRIDSLEQLRQQALDNGVEFIACNMSMDMMGIAHEELLDGVGIGGAATYMDRAEQSNVNLFL